MEVGVAYSIALYKMPQSLGDKFLTKLQQAFLESHRVSMDFSNVLRVASFPGSPGTRICIAGRARYLFYVSMT